MNSNLESKWYILQVYSNYEARVVEAIKEKIAVKGLTDLIEEIIVPIQEVATIKKGKKSTIRKNFLPGYILIKMHLTDELLTIIRNIPRVSSFLGSKGHLPTAVSKDEIDKILGKIEETASANNVVESKFEVGESVAISEGPFASFNGVIEDVDNVKNKLRVSVSIFGRLTPVELDFTQVEKINN